MNGDENVDRPGSVPTQSVGTRCKNRNYFDNVSSFPNKVWEHNCPGNSVSRWLRIDHHLNPTSLVRQLSERKANNYVSSLAGLDEFGVYFAPRFVLI